MNSIGVIYQLANVLELGAEQLQELGVECVQIQCFTPELYTEENAKKVKEALEGKIRISSLWVGWTGPRTWDFRSGPHLLGLVPEAYRANRLNDVLKGIEFASWLGVKNVATHMGYLPENPTVPAPVR